MSLNREGAMYGNGRGLRGNAPQGRMMQDGRGMRNGNPQGRTMQETRGLADNYRRDMECDCVVTETTEECECRNIPDIPAGNRMQLLTYIDEVSFCAYDLMLYLDTHPEDERAMEYFGKYKEKRDHALALYEEKYGPLQFHVMNLRSKSMTQAALSSSDDSAQRGSHVGQMCRCSAGSIKWVTEPWPWEGGEC